MKTALLLLCLVVGCVDGNPSASRSRDRRSNDLHVLTDDDSLLDDPATMGEPKDKESKRDILELTPFTRALLGSLVAINAWQMLQLYQHHRQLGELNAKLDRGASNTESEKRTRAYVNSLILSKLGFKENEIKRAVQEDENDK